MLLANKECCSPRALPGTAADRRLSVSSGHHRHVAAMAVSCRTEGESRRQIALRHRETVIATGGLGDTEQALARVEKSFAEKKIKPLALKADPLYDPLRSNPRFTALLRQAGFTP